MVENKLHRVGLIGSERLLAEGLQNLLQNLDDVLLLGPWEVSLDVLEAIAAKKPEIIILAESGIEQGTTEELIARVLKDFPDLPLVEVCLTKDVFRVYVMQLSPARSAVLVDLIRHLPFHSAEEQDSFQPPQEVN